MKSHFKVKKKGITTLYRAIDTQELEALQAFGFRRFPPCTEGAFYPALNVQAALESLGEREPALHITRFRIDARYVRNFEVQTLSGEVHDELWVPAEELETFNENIVGRIVVCQ